MIKVLKKFQVQMSPFQATKDWALNNTDNENLVLFESTGSDDGEPIALEYIDYDSGIGFPVVNSNCDIALEPQDADRVIFREGQKVTGPFYPNTDPTNPDGTYKRSIYYQVKSSFYNDYRDFTKLLGIEKLDFELSKTKRRLEDNIKLFNIPRLVFGDKIIPNTVEIPSDTLDNDLTIVDDGNGNLFAGTNLFSHQQEIGDFSNVFVAGSNSTCDPYFDFTVPKDPYALTASQVGITLNVYLNWLDGPADGFVVERSVDSGSNYSQLTFTNADITHSNDTSVIGGNTYWYRVYAYNSFGNSGYTNTASVTIVTGIPPIGIPTITASLVWIAAPTNLTASLLPIVSLINSATASLTWTDNSDNEDGFVIERSVNSASWTTLLTTPANISSSYDSSSVMIGSTYSYRVYAFNAYTSSVYSNVASVYFTGSLDTFDEYALGQSNTFNGGYGWVGDWYQNSTDRLIASESFDEYSLGQIASFGGGYGWTDLWNTGSVPIYMVSSESFDEYSLGQTGSFGSGYGWVGLWNTGSVPIYLVSSESFDEYSLGQTTGFGGGFGWSGSWTDFSGSI